MIKTCVRLIELNSYFVWMVLHIKVIDIQQNNRKQRQNVMYFKGTLSQTLSVIHLIYKYVRPHLPQCNHNRLCRVPKESNLYYRVTFGRHSLLVSYLVPSAFIFWAARNTRPKHSPIFGTFEQIIVFFFDIHIWIHFNIVINATTPFNIMQTNIFVKNIYLKMIIPLFVRLHNDMDNRIENERRRQITSVSRWGRGFPTPFVDNNDKEKEFLSYSKLTHTNYY